MILLGDINYALTVTLYCLLIELAAQCGALFMYRGERLRRHFYCFFQPKYRIMASIVGRKLEELN